MPTKCKKDEIWREGYVRKTSKGSKRIKGTCIKATSQTGKKTSKEMRKKLSKRAKIHEKAKEKFEIPVCSKGEILREGFSRETKGKTIWVPPTCVPDTGKKGKGQQLFYLEPERLTKYGYDDIESKSDLARHRALSSAINNGEKPLSVMRRLIAIATMNKNTNPKLSELIRQDAEWLKQKYLV